MLCVPGLLGRALTDWTTNSYILLCTMQKNLLGLVQGAPCRIEFDYKDEQGSKHKQTALVKTKTNDSEELPLYTNKDSVMGEVRRWPSDCG